MGGFTTAVACDNTKRKWVGFELEPEYCEKGKDRVNENREILGLSQVEIIKV